METTGKYFPRVSKIEKKNVTCLYNVYSKQLMHYSYYLYILLRAYYLCVTIYFIGIYARIIYVYVHITWDVTTSFICKYHLFNVHIT